MAKLPKMTKQHFCFIADIILSLRYEIDTTPVVHKFMGALRRTTPKFSQDTFIEACLLTKEERSTKRKADQNARRKLTSRAKPKRKLSAAGSMPAKESEDE